MQTSWGYGKCGHIKAVAAGEDDCVWVDRSICRSRMHDFKGFTLLKLHQMPSV